MFKRGLNVLKKRPKIFKRRLEDTKDMPDPRAIEPDDQQRLTRLEDTRDITDLRAIVFDDRQRLMQLLGYSSPFAMSEPIQESPAHPSEFAGELLELRGNFRGSGPVDPGAGPPRSVGCPHFFAVSGFRPRALTFVGSVRFVEPSTSPSDPSLDEHIRGDDGHAGRRKSTASVGERLTSSSAWEHARRRRDRDLRPSTIPG